MRILHLSADYPDPLEPAKTRAVSNLLALAEGHEHKVISLNRIRPGNGIVAVDFADPAGAAHRAIAYPSPPKGIFLKRNLYRLADWIIEDCRAAGFRPDLVHAHKLTMEGLAGARLAAHWSVPLAVSVQGNTDLKIARARPDLRRLYRDIWQKQAAIVFPFAPWGGTALDALLGTRDGPRCPLPCPTPADTLMSPRASGDPIIRTALNLRDAPNKNVARLIAAVGRISAEVPDIHLDIIGGGSPQNFADLSDVAAKQAPGRVRFIGTVPHAEMQALLNEATAFALVSHRESYGMVFSEALLAGTPCLIPRGRAIDGYFEEGTVLLAANPASEEEIAAGLVRLIREEAEFKSRLAALGASGGLDLLRRPVIAKTYLEALPRPAG